MRSILPCLAMASVALVAAATEAEARRGFRIGFGVSPARAAPTPAQIRPASGPSLVVVPGLSRGSRAAPALAPALLPAAFTSGAPAAASERKAPEPPRALTLEEWCPSKRVAGSGAGFCVIN